jgi:hypothetical protein
LHGWAIGTLANELKDVPLNALSAIQAIARPLRLGKTPNCIAGSKNLPPGLDAGQSTNTVLRMQKL